MSDLEIPELCLVVLVGITGSGKSTFAATHFRPTEVISSDTCRALVADDPTDQAATADAFEVLEYIAAKRLGRGLLTVVDATSVQASARKSLVELARSHDVLPVAVVLDVPVAVALQRTESRTDRDLSPRVVTRQHDQLRRSLRSLKREGFRTVHVLDGVEAIDDASITRTRLFNDRRDDHGPFDIVGDVHGCREELEDLLVRLGYTIVRDGSGRAVDAVHPDSRRVLFVGDLVDRGPDSVGVLRLAMGMVGAGHALCVTGNHEAKLVRALGRRDVTRSHGLQETLDQLAVEGDDVTEQVRAFCDALVAHYVLDDGRLVVAHAGLPEKYHGRASGRVRAFALYGDTSGETDEFGLPVRYPWAQDYRGSAVVVYGHTPVPEVEWVNNTLCVDTGCVFGGSLSALRYPEREVVAVPARAVHYEPVRPVDAAVDRDPAQLTLSDVMGARVVETEHLGRVSVRAEHAAGALEVMSRFALAPSQVVHLPPTMSPVDSSTRDGYLEHPDEAFGHYARSGVAQVVCEEKHMGSRAILRLDRDGTGVVHTRTGRAFFTPDRESAILRRAADAATAAGLWSDLGADRIMLDAEILPWAEKADAMIRSQYARVGAAATTALPAAVEQVSRAAGRGVEVADLLRSISGRVETAAAFVDAYRRYAQPSAGPLGVQVAPFQVLASGSQTFETRDHLWHLDVADRLVSADADLFRPTRRLVVDTGDETATGQGVGWWEELTANGGEGMVVKPLANLTRGRRGLVQPGVKVRGREYLRIIYGPDYTDPDTLARLRTRNLATKRSLALREYALGLEALRRFTTGEPVWRVHQAVFAVLAMESEPVDARL
ncbi:polynucleotide kinase-phosphatase [Williamsia sp. SKLECPSW1]